METGSTPLSPEQVREVIRGVQSGGEEKAARLASLRKALRNPESQLTFIKSENSMHMLIGQLSSHNAQCQLEAARCLHELSHSTQSSVGQACLPAGPYLLTYLSSQSTKLVELCLYTLGNLCPDSAVVREKLLAQGIVSALANCIHIQRYNLAVVEAAGFTLSQLLQAKDATEKIIPNLDNSKLIAQGALSQCSAVLITLGGAVAQGNLEGGIELLIWPLLRCLGNLLVSGGDVMPEDTRLLAALCVFSQAYLHPHPALSRESLWALNNLTAGSSGFCSGLLLLNMVPILIQFLSFSKGINSMALRVLGNIAHHGPEYCVRLTQAGLLTALCATLKMAEPEVVTLSLEVLYMLVSSTPQLHPDSDPSNPGLHSQFVQLNEAYRVLSREGSRRDYDLRLRYQYAAGPAFRASSSTSGPSAKGAESIRYWEQFRQAQPQESTAEEQGKRKKRNMRLVGYCILTMVVSLSVHYFGFRKLEEVHNNFMDEKDRVITEIYNTSKERARVNGFKKQQEILRQKHAEFLERYKIRNNGEEK
ncbi:transmembrane and coiled-coil domain-containing 6 isoform X1 [Labeo rohita]|uniref:Transmembrane and coiled-coil domain-containing 6 isoform X1 n=1 Tax=Labeo rohita TaxID=84645 RepID=A0A498NBA3_LABRO|nr:transmembrane and coiled-coil domain-containing 6 isoform X1 [Labeo rohita]